MPNNDKIKNEIAKRKNKNLMIGFSKYNANEKKKYIYKKYGYTHWTKNKEIFKKFYIKQQEKFRVKCTFFLAKPVRISQINIKDVIANFINNTEKSLTLL